MNEEISESISEGDGWLISQGDSKCNLDSRPDSQGQSIIIKQTVT